MLNKKEVVEGESFRLNGRLNFPSIIFGTSCLGNLYEALDEKIKVDIIRECFLHSKGTVVFDTAGKYGAGLALESLGKSLRKLQIKPEDVIISNKLGWVRSELKTSEPTFEPGVWKGLQYDAVQKISYQGIIECFEQGNVLLDGYVPQLVSVHDPDEYIARARSEAEAANLYFDILEAYRALEELKAKGKIIGIGVGAKDWRIIERISKDVTLDWVMIANSMTILNHPKDLVTFMQTLKKKGVHIFNSAVFHGGFLVGGDYYDYKHLKPDTDERKSLFSWRNSFFKLCKRYGVIPAEACAQFSLHAPGVVSLALNTSIPERVKENIHIFQSEIPAEFWVAMKNKGLIQPDFPTPGIDNESSLQN